MVPIVDFLVEVTHAGVFAAAREELAEFAEDEVQRIGVRPAGAGGRDVGINRLDGLGFLFLLQALLLGLVLGLQGGLGVGAKVLVGRRNIFVQLRRDTDGRVTDECVDLGDLIDDAFDLADSVIAQPLIAEGDGGGDFGRVDAELDDGLAVADVGDVLTLRVSLLVFVKAELGFLELALVEPAQGVHVHCLFPRKGALVLLKELVEGDASLVPIDVGKVAAGDTEVDFLQRGWINFLHVGLGPIVVADGFFVFFAVLGNRPKDDSHYRDLFGVRVLGEELLALRLGLAVAADFAEG